MQVKNLLTILVSIFIIYIINYYLLINLLLTGSIFSDILCNMLAIFNPIKNTLSAFLNLIYPKRCQGCGAWLNYKNNTHLCSQCIKNITINKPPFCIKCGRSIFGPINLRAVCGKCIQSKFNFDGAFSCCNYEGLIKDLIHKFKYNHKAYLSDFFGNLLINFTRNHINTDKIDMVVPIPLHRGKLQQRGFDQSLLLSKKVSKILKMPLFHNILKRKKDTRQQASLNRTQRLQNIKGAFSITNKSILNKKRVLLVDDVFTTAATANECAITLKAAGADSVHLLTLARGL